MATIEQIVEKVKTRTETELSLRPNLHGSLTFHFRDGNLMKRRVRDGDDQLTIEITEKE